MTVIAVVVVCARDDIHSDSMSEAYEIRNRVNARSTISHGVNNPFAGNCTPTYLNTTTVRMDCARQSSA